MTSAEMVTKFVIRRDHWTLPDGRTFGYCGQAREALGFVWPHPKACENPESLGISHRVEMTPIIDLLQALNDHCKALGIEFEEYEFCLLAVYRPEICVRA